MDTIIDTHCHAGLDKYEPIEALAAELQALRRTYLAQADTLAQLHGQLTQSSAAEVKAGLRKVGLKEGMKKPGRKPKRGAKAR